MSTRTQIPINSSMLIWTKKTAGYTVESLTKEFPKLEEWESGDSSPTYGRLEALAAKYHRPIAIFFFPNPPEEPRLEKSLRAISEDEVINLSPRMRYLFRKAESFQINLKELLLEQSRAQEEKVSWLKNLPTKAIVSLAGEVRKKLGITIEAQSSWKDSDTALKQWQKILSDNGVYVFKDAFKNEKISGFCVYNDLFPVIFLNNSHSKNRQIFTVFHELAHLIFRQSYLDIFDYRMWQLEDQDPQHIEVKCNSFASHFLIPASDFDREYEKRKYSTSPIEELAAFFKVSREVVLRRLLDKGVISKEHYLKTISQLYETPVQEEDTSKSGSYYNNIMAYLGEPYLTLVFKEYYRGAFGPEKASEYLGTPVKSFSAIEERLLSRNVL